MALRTSQNGVRSTTNERISAGQGTIAFLGLGGQIIKKFELSNHNFDAGLLEISANGAPRLLLGSSWIEVSGGSISTGAVHYGVGAVAQTTSTATTVTQIPAPSGTNALLAKGGDGSAKVSFIKTLDTVSITAAGAGATTEVEFSVDVPDDLIANQLAGYQFTSGGDLYVITANTASDPGNNDEAVITINRPIETTIADNAVLVTTLLETVSYEVPVKSLIGNVISQATGEPTIELLGSSTIFGTYGTAASITTAGPLVSIVDKDTDLVATDTINGGNGTAIVTSNSGVTGLDERDYRVALDDLGGVIGTSTNLITLSTGETAAVSDGSVAFVVQ